MVMEVREVSITSEIAMQFISNLDNDLMQLYPGEKVNGLNSREFQRLKGVFLVAYDGEIPVGCGALYPLSSTAAELKRIYVLPAQRGRGIARRILSSLEKIARGLKLKELYVETGDKQPEAIRLYQNCGFSPIDSFGEYKGSPRSKCFMMTL